MKCKVVFSVFALLVLIVSCAREPINDSGSSSVFSSDTNDRKLINICLEKNIDGVDNDSRAGKALLIDKLWENGQTIKVKFLSGNESLRNRIWQQAIKWEEYANIKFELVNSGDAADIRINVDDSNASWSYIGTDALTIDRGAATMNFGWFDNNSTTREIQRTTLHEFGHALGAVHEHQNPDAKIQWNEPVVIDYYETNFNWTESQVRRNIFDKYYEDETTYSQYDPESIMNYAIDNEFTLNDFSLDWNYDLSELDKSFIGETYPFAPKKTTENLALGKVAQQSSTNYGAEASRAVDGNTSGDWRFYSSTSTLSEDRPWWQVRLGEEYAIGDINIYNRTSPCCKDILVDFDVFVYNDAGELMFKTRINENPNPMITVNAGGVIGSRVRVKLSTFDVLTLAEVEVYEN